MRALLGLVLLGSLAAGEFDQVAGHAGGFSSEGNGVIVKKVYETEARFYLDLDADSELAALLPVYHGSSVRLEDLTEGFIEPNIMDIKMGTRTWTELSSAKKRKKCEVSDSRSTTKTLGMRISGARIAGVKLEREVCKAMSSSELQQTLAQFFGAREGLAAEFKRELKPILAWFEQNHDLQFTASSLLFIYEGAAVESPKSPVVKMIDFRYVHPTNGAQDERYLVGLTNLMSELDRVEKL